MARIKKLGSGITPLFYPLLPFLTGVLRVMDDRPASPPYPPRPPLMLEQREEVPPPRLTDNGCEEGIDWGPADSPTPDPNPTSVTPPSPAAPAFPQLDSPLRLSLPHPGTRGTGGKKKKAGLLLSQDRTSPKQHPHPPLPPFGSLSPVSPPRLHRPLSYGHPPASAQPAPPSSSPSLLLLPLLSCCKRPFLLCLSVPSRAGIAPAAASRTAQQKMAGGGRQTHPTSPLLLPPPRFPTALPAPSPLKCPGGAEGGLPGTGGAASLTCGEPGRHLSEGRGLHAQVFLRGGGSGGEGGGGG